VSYEKASTGPASYHRRKDRRTLKRRRNETEGSSKDGRADGTNEADKLVAKATSG
jgi:hypothetical protein